MHATATTNFTRKLRVVGLGARLTLAAAAGCSATVATPAADTHETRAADPSATSDAGEDRSDGDAGADVSLQQAAVRVPEKLAFFYGQPSNVNKSVGNTALAIDTFKAYDIVVLGDGLDAATHPDHAKTASIIAGVAPSTRVYGYIDLCVQVAGVPCTNLPIAEIRAKADRWKAMGAAGIFLDQAGYDYAVSRARLNEAVDYVHAIGLSAFPNAWVPDDIFGADPHPLNPMGVETHLGPKDYALDESFAVTLSQYQDPAHIFTKAMKEVAYKQRFGTKIATTNTVAAANPPFDAAMFDYEWWAALVFGFDAVAWGESYSYSSNDDLLPFHPRPAPGDLGTAPMLVTVTKQGSTFTRSTSKGTIELDTVGHAGRFRENGAMPGTTSAGITQPATKPTDLKSGSASYGPSAVALTVTSNGAEITSYRVFLDTDESTTTGFLHSSNTGLGADYMIENGVLYKFSGASQTAFAWTRMGAASATKTTAGTLQVSVGLAQVGLAAGAKMAVLVENVAPSFATLDVLSRAPAVWRVRP